MMRASNRAPTRQWSGGAQFGVFRIWVAVAAMLFASLALPAQAQNFPELTGQVVDAANIIPDEDEAALVAQSQRVEREKGYQFVIATIPSLEGYDIDEYGTKLGRAWGIGRKEVNDGVILIIAPNDRKVRIEVGQGLEPVLTDALSSVIINSQIIPRFKAGDMPGGIKAGAETISTQLLLPAPDAESRAKRIVDAQKKDVKVNIDIGTIIWLAIIFFFFVLPMLRAIFGRRKGKRYRRDDDDDDDWGGGGGWPIIVWGGGGGGGSGWSGGGGSFGGGGGWSGGGGSFGGGGASGGW